MIFKGPHPVMYSSHTRSWMTEFLYYFRNLSVCVSLLCGQSSIANAHKDSKNKFLPLVCGCLFKKDQKHIKDVYLVKTNWKCENFRGVGLQLLRMLRSTEEQHHHRSNHTDSSYTHPPTPGSRQRPQNHLNRIKECHYCGEPSLKLVMQVI